jgi:hypothetical protein
LNWVKATPTNFSFWNNPMKLLEMLLGEETSKICKYSLEKKMLFAEKSFQLLGNSDVELKILNENEVFN